MGHISYKDYIAQYPVNEAAKAKVPDQVEEKREEIDNIINDEFIEKLVNVNVMKYQSKHVKDVEEFKKDIEKESDKAKAVADKRAALKVEIDKLDKEIKAAKDELTKAVANAADPRVAAYSRYAMAKAQTKAIEGLKEKTEAFTNDEEKKALDELLKKRQEQEEKEEENMNQKLSKIEIPENEIPAGDKDSLDKLYAKSGKTKGADGKDVDTYKRKFGSLKNLETKATKDVEGTWINLQNEDAMKKLGVTDDVSGKLSEFINKVPDEYQHSWYSKTKEANKAIFLPMKNMNKLESVEEYFDILNEKFLLKGKTGITKETVGAKLMKAIAGVDDEDAKNNIMEVFKWATFLAVLGGATNVDVAKIYEEDSKKASNPEIVKEMFDAATTAKYTTLINIAGLTKFAAVYKMLPDKAEGDEKGVTFSKNANVSKQYYNKVKTAIYNVLKEIEADIENKADKGKIIKKLNDVDKFLDMLLPFKNGETLEMKSLRNKLKDEALIEPVTSAVQKKDKLELHENRFIMSREEFLFEAKKAKDDSEEKPTEEKSKKKSSKKDDSKKDDSKEKETTEKKSKGSGKFFDAVKALVDRIRSLFDESEDAQSTSQVVPTGLKDEAEEAEEIEQGRSDEEESSSDDKEEKKEDEPSEEDFNAVVEYVKKTLEKEIAIKYKNKLIGIAE